MTDERRQQGASEAEEAEEAREAMGEATGDTLKAPAGVEDEPSSKDRPEGTPDPERDS